MANGTDSLRKDLQSIFGHSLTGVAIDNSSRSLCAHITYLVEEHRCRKGNRPASIG